MVPVDFFPSDLSREPGWRDRFSAELLGSIAEAVVDTDPVARGDAICQLLEEVVAGLAGIDTGLVRGELASLRHVADEANAHRAWLATAQSVKSQTAVTQAS